MVISSMASGCPPKALVLQIELLQTAINSPLDLETGSSADMNRAHVEKLEDSDLAENWVLKVMGHFDWQRPGGSVSVESSFE